MPGTKWKASLQNPKMYGGLRKAGFDKTAAAKISNAKTAGNKVVRTAKWKAAKK